MTASPRKWRSNFLNTHTTCRSELASRAFRDRNEQRLIKNDFAWASQNRDSILAEWRKRYDGKSEKVAQ